MKFNIFILLTEIIAIITCTIISILYLLGIIKTSNTIIITIVIIQSAFAIGTTINYIYKIIKN